MTMEAKNSSVTHAMDRQEDRWRLLRRSLPWSCACLLTEVFACLCARRLTVVVGSVRLCQCYYRLPYVRQKAVLIGFPRVPLLIFTIRFVLIGPVIKGLVYETLKNKQRQIKQEAPSGGGMQTLAVTEQISQIRY